MTGLHDLPGDAGDDRRLTGAAHLVAPVEPAPVAAVAHRPGLFGVGDEKRVFLGQLAHPGAGREVDSGLGAAVQHHDERHRIARVPRRDVEVVGP